MYGQELLAGGPNGGMMSSWGMGQPMTSGETLMPMYRPDGNIPITPAPNPQFGQQAGSGFGMNIGTANLALAGLNTIGNLWAAFEARKLAKEQFNFTKSVTNTNLANSIASYNTALSDRARSRGFTEGQSQAQIDKYIADNRAVKKG
jgi:hypothetical protein